MRNMKRTIALLSLVMISLGMMAQEFDDRHALSIGYINKEWVSEFPDGDYHENIFGQEGKRLHGVQIMYHYSPYLPIGLGIHTGLAYEWCMSYSDEIKKMGFERFNEHSIYVPVHAMWRIPLGKNASLAPYAGVAINWKVGANMKSGYYDGIFDDYHDRYFYRRWGMQDYAKVRYGRDGWPHALNTQMELGFRLNIEMVSIGFTYSKGLKDHEFYRDERVKTRQDKLAITIGLNLGSD